LIADLVIDKKISAVLDISQFTMKDRRKFFTAFATQLFQRRKAEKFPTHLVFEEAQVFAPQKPQKGDEMMLHICEQLVRLGRNFGIGASLITQRPQSVNKEVLNQVECLFALQTNGTQERKAISDWICYQGFDKNLANELPELPHQEGGNQCNDKPLNRIYRVKALLKQRYGLCENVVFHVSPFCPPFVG